MLESASATVLRLHEATISMTDQASGHSSLIIWPRDSVADFGLQGIPAAIGVQGIHGRMVLMISRSMASMLATPQAPGGLLCVPAQHPQRCDSDESRASSAGICCRQRRQQCSQ